MSVWDKEMSEALAAATKARAELAAEIADALRRYDLDPVFHARVFALVGAIDSQRMVPLGLPNAVQIVTVLDYIDRKIAEQERHS